MKAQLSWHVQNCDLIGSIKWKPNQMKFHRDLNYELIKFLWNGSRHTCSFQRTHMSHTHKTTPMSLCDPNEEGAWWKKIEECVLKLSFIESVAMYSIAQKIYRDHSAYVLSQWEVALHCNAISHWLGTYTEWSLNMHIILLYFVS